MEFGEKRPQEIKRALIEQYNIKQKYREPKK
jgi:hypothetical protein